MSHEPQATTAHTKSTADIAAIRQLVAHAEKSQSDIAPFLDLHTPDTVIVNIAGRRVLGREALHDAMTAALAGPLANVFTRNEITDIRFLRPDVALVSCIKHVSDERTPNSGPTLPTTATLTYVVVKNHETWHIAFAQTTATNT